MRNSRFTLSCVHRFRNEGLFNFYRLGDERENCRQRIAKAEARLNYAVTNHGETSKEARERWHELRAQREHGWTSYHPWWSGRDQRGHTEPDRDHDDRWPEEAEQEHK